jgi:hypothetical protein
MTNFIGELINKLYEVDYNLWKNQECLYDMRRMRFDKFDDTYCKTIEGKKKLYTILNNLCDLNYERNVFIDSIDETFVDFLKKNCDK